MIKEVFMNGLKKLKGLVACLSIIVLSMSLVGCGKKEEESKKIETELMSQELSLLNRVLKHHLEILIEVNQMKMVM